MPDQSNATPLLEFNAVNVDYGSRRVLSDISFSVARGEIVTVIGPNGAGKSSLVKTALGLQATSTGHVNRQPKLRIGYMPQRLNIDPQLPLTTARFLALSGNKQAVAQAAKRLNIECLLALAVQTLSGGELQRVLLARALLKSPELLVLDEPAQGVDVIGEAALYHLLSELRDELNCGILLVSHDLHIVMAQTDKVLCLNQHICCHGAPESVSQHPEYLQLFGRQAAKDIAVYSHDHDHAHDIHGEVLANEPHTHDGHCQHHKPS